ncbi:PREDICTED: transmembrane protein 214 [Nelumbo nucifera]|uniref:Transmembrane protein 214 n=1 Tax=Nelumbo nucifera TaxID=4432 RepID=A0A1U8B5L3_NELNU|nr:PREDICTED: transmembrane protein 214 [Nelumbo nucifera]
MDEKSAVALESAFYEDDESSSNNASSNNNHGWQKVTYAKRQRKPKPSDAADPSKFRPNGVVVVGDEPNVFQSLEEQAKERRRRVEAQKAAAAAAAAAESVVKSKHHSDDDGDDSDVEAADGGENAATEEKKPKQKKPKKPKVTVAEAASKIDASDLAAHLASVTASYESQQDIQLMRFADYFGRAFSQVSAAQFPWTKIFKESTVAKITDIPLSHISEAVYRTSTDWINQRSPEALVSFVLWSLDSILADLAHQQGPAKGSKKVVQHAPSKAQVAIFVVLAMVLRRKPDVLISILPVLRDNTKYQGQDKLPVIVWMISQACQGDLVVGMFAWAHNLLPIVSGKNSNPQSRDLILQLVERILSAPKARSILLNGAVRKGERLVPPSAFEMLMRTTFPPPAARIKATERFEAIYPPLKELALSGSPGSKAMKQVSQQILNFVVQAAGEAIPELSKEAVGVFIWCLTQNPDCYKIWDKIYLDNIKASAAVLRKLSDEWKEHSVKHSSLDPLKVTLKSFRQKNETALASGGDASDEALIKDADKYCKVILGRISRGHGCMKSVFVACIAVAVGALIMSPNMEPWDWKKLSVIFNSPGSI